MSRYTITQTASDKSWVAEFSPFSDGQESVMWYTGDTLTEVCLKIGGIEPEVREPEVTPQKVAIDLGVLKFYEDGSRRTIDCIKAIRAITGCGHQEAKEAYDEAARGI